MVWGWMPFLWVSGIVADLFAGERERHTLESLLATRLSDQSILFGKLLAALTYGFAVTWVVMLAGLVTVNIGFGRQGLLFYPVGNDFRCSGVQYSGLRAFRQYWCVGIAACRQCSSGPANDERRDAGIVLAIYADAVYPARMGGVGWQIWSDVGPVQIAIGVALVLLMIEAILVLIAMRLFQRSKLILD